MGLKCTLESRCNKTYLQLPAVVLGWKAPIPVQKQGGIGWNAPQPTPGKFLQIVHIFGSPSKLPAEQSEKHKVDSLGGEMVEVALSNFWWGFSMIVTPQ